MGYAVSSTRRVINFYRTLNPHAYSTMPSPCWKKLWSHLSPYLSRWNVPKSNIFAAVQATIDKFSTISQLYSHTSPLMSNRGEERLSLVSFLSKKASTALSKLSANATLTRNYLYNIKIQYVSNASKVDGTQYHGSGSTHQTFMSFENDRPRTLKQELLENRRQISPLMTYGSRVRL